MKCLTDTSICSHLLGPDCKLLRPSAQPSTSRYIPTRNQGVAARPALAVQYPDMPDTEMDGLLPQDVTMTDGSYTQLTSPSTSHSPQRGSPSEIYTDDEILSGPDIALKLFRMLEDGSKFKDVISWGPKGDRFIIHDASEFTKAVLPKLFRHSNFSSFVRQLNKYDFHKVRRNHLCPCGVRF
jgi:hypothetical protein